VPDFLKKNVFQKKYIFKTIFFFQNISGTTSFRSQEIVSGMFWRISVLHENLKKIEKNCKNNCNAKQFVMQKVLQCKNICNAKKLQCKNFCNGLQTICIAKRFVIQTNCNAKTFAM